jgi:TetR/AcrR family transcriptional regulator, transcriptional repressor for nem operon
METVPSAKTNSTRDHVLTHAAALIRERGFRSTSIGDLLERADVQKGSFYYYFPSKEALGHAVLDRWTEELQNRLLAPLTAPEGPPPLERIYAALEGFLSEQEASNCRGGCPFGNLAIELADVHEGFRTRLSAAFSRLSSAFADLLERARRSGQLRADADPQALGEFLVASVEGGILLAKVHKSSATLATVLRQAREHVDCYRSRE